MITRSDILKRLTDVFTKDPNSNIGKLISIMADQFRALEESQNRTREWRNIDLAEGTTLDHVGQNVVQPRGAARDEVYRILIKSKIARNLSTGDINTIIRVLSTALNTKPSEIEIRELYSDPISPEPAAISVIKLPLKAINESGMSPLTFARIVQRTVAAGVRVGVIELSGTFSFSSVPDQSEMDNNAGFGNIEGTIGGYLGAAYSPDKDDDLPI
ncbi:hypothetical protein [Paenibacillus tyrfis]|uniref:DUF2612 domain-containing protein n=1 Tax=Paenibacillus tyrfis TaxID=1501230 RepID=A0A081NWR2_9BACL|nr:hypothetical protein [Paenibacillus tyrfis]KEQ22885.1 hypothetical protein ET33_21310 [Paenibacillus tyrfis]